MGEVKAPNNPWGVLSHCRTLHMGTSPPSAVPILHLLRLAFHLPTTLTEHAVQFGCEEFLPVQEKVTFVVPYAAKTSPLIL